MKIWLARRSPGQRAALAVMANLLIAGLWLWIGINLGKLLWQWLG